MQFHFNLFHTDTATGHTACYPGYDTTAAAALLLYRLRGSSGARRSAGVSRAWHTHMETL